MRHTVLVVDDEASIDDGLRLTLEAEGYSVRIAGSVRTGLAAVTPTDVPQPSQVTALRNLLYALQWWVFGLFALVVWFRWCRDQLVTDSPVPSSA